MTAKHRWLIRRLTVLGGAVLALGSPGNPARAQEWKIPATAPLLTQWAKEVSPTNAHPEYPRPALVREDWQDLNGLWDYAVTAKAAEQAPRVYDGKILVPYCIESALSGVMKPLTPQDRLWYHRTFTLPGGWAGRRVLLHFEAVDWETTVYLNGKNLGSHRGSYDAFTFDITGALKGEGRQELVVSDLDPTDTGWQLRGKQVLHPIGCSYTACSGIWQTVWLEPVPTNSVDALKVVPDVKSGVLHLTVDGRIAPGSVAVEATVLDGSEKVATASGTLGAEFIAAGSPDRRRNRLMWVTTDLDLAVKDAKPWTPDTPFLYDLVVELKDRDGKVVDTVRSYFGMRSVGAGKDEKGVERPLLNGKPLIMAGALDQGYWPDGVYTAPTDAALRYDIEAARKLGMNSVRKHVKMEPERWYYWADKLGLLVLQDMPTGKEGDPETDLMTSPAASMQCEGEKRLLIQQRWNHPSIIEWCPFNEGWGQHDTLRYAKWIKELDPSRLVDEASGFNLHGGGDVNDRHGGFGGPSGNRFGIVSEDGGYGVDVEGHCWSREKDWTYQTFDEQTGRQIEGQMRNQNPGKPIPILTPASKNWMNAQVVKMYNDFWHNKVPRGMSGDFFCQLTDVEVECDGLLSYDRAVFKVDPEVVGPAISGASRPTEK
ncbi:MAG: sugar-binding domain-containing protein [Verrucomicrobiota bacterium]